MNRKSLSLIHQANEINGGAGGECRLFGDLSKCDESPNNRYHSDRAGRGVIHYFVQVEIYSLFEECCNSPPGR